MVECGTSAGKVLSLPLIIPLVFYHGKQEWKIPLSITECIDADQELREFMSDETILITLETRFGPVSSDMEAQVRRSSPELLDDLFKRALTAASLELVFTGDSRH
jgi:hypothetical protein